MGSLRILSRLALVCGAVVFNGVIPMRWIGHAGGTAVAALQKADDQKAPAASKGPYALILVIDAARNDEFDLSKMPHLAALAASGTRFNSAWVGQLPSVTEASHATVGTGVFPRRHLILGDTWRVPGTQHMAPNLLDGNLVRTGYIGKLIQATHV